MTELGTASARGWARPSADWALAAYHPDELADATMAPLEWADAQGLSWDMAPADGGERWSGQLEFYLTDPGEEPDMSKWVTQLAFRLAGENALMAGCRHDE